MQNLQIPLSLTATRCLHVLEAGRTRPWIIVGEDTVGNEHEIVVKLRGKHMNALSQAVELVSSMLAQYLGLSTPRAAIVDVSNEFIHSLSRENQVAFANSTGVNFGSEYLQGVSTLPQQMSLPKGLRTQAASIFAFDLLIQNPDRRSMKPNVLLRQDSIVAIDHEQGFNWLIYPVIGSASNPWENGNLLDSFAFVQEHLFLHQLQKIEVDLSEFQTRLAGLSDEYLLEMHALVPVEWVDDHSLLEDITKYLQDAREHSAQFINNVKYLLR